jgi:hypothetical protein
LSGDEVKTGALASPEESGMERRFKVEAKSFFFSTKASQLRLEERRKGFLGLILVDLRGAAWLAETVEEASRSPALADFDRSSSEGRKSLTVRGGCNKGGRFLEVVAFMDDNRKGIIWIPEARSGRGWRRFVSELRSWLAALASSPGFSSEGSFTEEKVVEGIPAIKNGRTYADVVRDPSCVVEVGRPQLLSTQEIDLFPVASSFEMGYDGRGLESAFSPSSAEVTWEVQPPQMEMPVSMDREEDRFELELSALALKISSVCATAASVDKRKKTMEGIWVIRWLMKFLGFSGTELDRVVDGLRAGPMDGTQVKPKEFVGVDPISDPGMESVQCVACGPDPGPVFGSVSGPDHGPVSEPANGPCEFCSPVWGLVSSRPSSVSASGDGSGLDVGDGSVFAGSATGEGSISDDGSVSAVISACEGAVTDSGAGKSSGKAGDGSVSDPAGVADYGSDFFSPAPPPFPAALDLPGEGAVSAAGDGLVTASGSGMLSGPAGEGSVSGSARIAGDGSEPVTASTVPSPFPVVSESASPDSELDGSESKKFLDPDPDPKKCVVGVSLLDFCTFDTIIDTTAVELTDTQLGLIERMRKELKVNDTTKVALKYIEEIFLRVNKGVRDGVLPAEEGESILAFHFEQIEKFLGGILVEQPRFKGKRERVQGPSRTRMGKITEM